MFDDTVPKYVNKPCETRCIVVSNNYQIKVLELPDCYWRNNYYEKSFREMLDMIYESGGKQLYPEKLGYIPDHDETADYIWESTGIRNGNYTYWVKTEYKYLPRFFQSDTDRDYYDCIKDLKLPHFLSEDRFYERTVSDLISHMIRDNHEYLKKANLVSKHGGYWSINATDVNKMYAALRKKINK